jgi:DNA-binding NtrC family response regulator
MVNSKARQAKVLIVDDEEDLCWTLTKILEDLNYQVLSAHTGKSALRHLQKDKNIRFTLLDVRLPDLGEAGGLSLIKKMKRIRPRMSVVAMSAFGSPFVKTQAKRLGAVAFVDKPFRIEKLLKLIRETMGEAVSS